MAEARAWAEVERAVAAPEVGAWATVVGGAVASGAAAAKAVEVSVGATGLCLVATVGLMGPAAMEMAAKAAAEMAVEVQVGGKVAVAVVEAAAAAAWRGRVMAILAAVTPEAEAKGVEARAAEM